MCNPPDATPLAPAPQTGETWRCRKCGAVIFRRWCDACGLSGGAPTEAPAAPAVAGEGTYWRSVKHPECIARVRNGQIEALATEDPGDTWTAESWEGVLLDPAWFEPYSPRVGEWLTNGRDCWEVCGFSDCGKHVYTRHMADPVLATSIDIGEIPGEFYPCPPPDTAPAKPAKQKRGKWRKRAEEYYAEWQALRGELAGMDALKEQYRVIGDTMMKQRDAARAEADTLRRQLADAERDKALLKQGWIVPDPPPAAPATSIAEFALRFPSHPADARISAALGAAPPTDPADDDRYLDGELVAGKQVWNAEYGALKVIRNAGMGLVDCIAPDGKQCRLYYSALTTTDQAGYREGQVLGLGETVRVYGADGEKLWQATVTQLLIEPGIKRLTVYARDLQPAPGWQGEETPRHDA